MSANLGRGGRDLRLAYRPPAPPLTLRDEFLEAIRSTRPIDALYGLLFAFEVLVGFWLLLSLGTTGGRP